ncbi:unnamed protein product [Moneuplotes crassus]|uniref:Uncharacterized protein n=1 Tax=Euplotes crassus TaxID=5936 RepID=A0AAD1U3T5_EUPCR|nr:unnamed protein product [Moneuplotes crassus]
MNQSNNLDEESKQDSEKYCTSKDLGSSLRSTISHPMRFGNIEEETWSHNRKDTINSFYSWDRTWKGMKDYVYRNIRDHIDECDAICNDINNHLQRELVELKNYNNSFKKSDLKKIEDKITPLWNKFKESDLFRTFCVEKVSSQYMDDEDDHVNRLKSKLTEKDMIILNYKIKLDKISKKLSEMNKSNVKDSDFKELRVMAKEIEMRVPGVGENKTKQASSRSELSYLAMRSAARSCQNNSPANGVKLKRMRKEENKNQEIAEENSEQENDDGMSVTIGMGDLNLQSDCGQCDVIDLSQHKSSEDELDPYMEKEIGGEPSQKLHKIIQPSIQQKDLSPNKLDPPNPGFEYSFGPNSEAPSSMTSKNISEASKTISENRRDDSSMQQNNLNMDTNSEQDVQKSKEDSEEDLSEETKKEPIEESKSDMHMEAGSQHSDDEISYPLEGSCVLYNLSSEQDQAFFRDCASKLPNLKLIEFRVNLKTPESFFEFCEKYFPDEVQNCKFSGTISPEFLPIGSFLDTILKISTNVKEALEINNFSLDQTQLDKCIEQCKAEKKLIFSSCLFSIRDSQDLFNFPSKPTIADLRFDEHCLSNLSTDLDSDPILLPFRDIIGSLKESEHYQKLFENPSIESLKPS